MSFDLELRADVTSWEDAERIAQVTATAGHVAVVPGRRMRWFRPLMPTIGFDWAQGQEVLSDDADWDHDAFLLCESGRVALAATVLTLASLLEPGWGIRAYWVGDPLREEIELSAHELAELVRASSLDRFTFYRIV